MQFVDTNTAVLYLDERLPHLILVTVIGESDGNSSHQLSETSLRVYYDEDIVSHCQGEGTIMIYEVPLTSVILFTFNLLHIILCTFSAISASPLSLLHAWTCQPLLDL